MLFSDVIVDFEKSTNIANYFKVTKGTVSKWKKNKVIPEKRALQLAMRMPEKFEFDPRLYRKQDLESEKTNEQ